MKSELGITDSDQDANLTEAILAASEEIAGYIGARTAEDGTITLGLEEIEETFDIACGTGFIELGRWPVVALTEITENGTVLGETDYIASLANGQLHRASGGYYRRWAHVPGLIKYTAGWVLPDDPDNRNLPRSIESAAILLVTTRHQEAAREPGVTSETIYDVRSVSYGSSADAYDQHSGMPRAVANLLRRYRRIPL